MATRVKRGRSGGNGLKQSDNVLYVYAISRGGADGHVATAGVDGASRVEPLAVADFTCWVSQVARQEFADRVQQNMQNLDWLAAASIRHQQVVTAVAKFGDVLPARFATVFLTESSLAKYVQQHKKELEAGFARIAGCDEWGVKVYAVRGGVATQPVAGESGKHYLQRKSAAMQARTPRIDSDIQELPGTLDAISREAAPSGSVSGGQPGLVWQRAYLVPRKNRKRLQAVLDDFARRWREKWRIECTGPWPPYSFVSTGGQELLTAESRT